MKLTALLSDDDAVSPVIGVILMVAITVILAAVVGTFLLGVGDQVGATAPQASFGFEFDASTTGSGTNFCGTSLGADGLLTITHAGGDGMPASQLAVTDGSSSLAYDTDCMLGSEVAAGTTVSADVDTDDTVRIVWASDATDESATLGRWVGPDA